MKSRLFGYLLLAVVLLSIFGKLISLAPRVANDFPYMFTESVKEGFNFPQVWSRTGENMGEYRVLTLWAWPIDFVYGFIGSLGFDFSILEHILGIFPIFILGAWSILNLLEYYKIGKLGKLVGTLFYLLNTYILLIVDGGQITVGLAYAFMPMAFLNFVKSIDSNFRQKIIAGISISILGFFDIRFIYILMILLSIKFLYDFCFTSNKVSMLLNWVLSASITSVLLLGANLYWILPTILVTTPSLPDTYNRIAQTSFLSFTQFKHSLLLLQPHWYMNVFGRIPPFNKEFLLIPILVFSATFLKIRDGRVWFWSIIALISVFLTKGTNQPFPGIYAWFFTHVPGFSLFRDSTKFFFLVALSYSVLIAFTVDEVTSRFSRLKIVFPCLVIIYLLFLIRPVYLGKMTGIFSEPRYKDDYFLAAVTIEKDDKFGRILWVPSRSPLGFSSPEHPVVEVSRIESLRPFAVGTVGAYESQNFIREANYMGELFDIAGIKYIAYPSLDPKRDDMAEEKVQYYETFLSQIGNLPWVEKKISDIPIPIYKTKESKGKFFLSSNTYFVIGSDKIYQDIKNLGAKFSNNALVFAEESQGLANRISDAPDAKIISYNKSIIDLFMAFANKDKFIFPSSVLDFSPNITGWWKRETVDFVWLRDFLQQKYGIDNLDFDYGGGWAIAEGSRELSIVNKEFSKGKVLYARVMQSSKGGEVDFYQGDKLIGVVDTKVKTPEKVTIKLTGSKGVLDKHFEYDKADFHWLRIGIFSENGSVMIKTKGDINIVDSLAVLTTEDEKELIQKATTLENEGKVLDWDRLGVVEKENLFSGETKAIVSYKTISPTHYKITIKGLAKPTTLFFSETFDSGWELNSKKGYKLYSLMNGFWVDKDGEYDLYFTPQKYVLPGLAISILTLSSCIMFLRWKRK